MIRRDLADRLARIWIRLDRDRDDFAQRFLSVFQRAIDEAEARAKGVLDLKSLDRIPDQYLRLLADLVGHLWKTGRPYQRNRREARRAIPRYSYKGTVASIGDLAEEYATTLNGYQDNASLLLVLNKQGHLSQRDCAIMSADYWHDGAFVWTVDRAGDPDGFIDELTTLRPVGERWYYEFITVLMGICEVDVTAHVMGTYSYANTQYGRLNVGTLGEDVHLSYEPVGGIEHTVKPIVWMDIELDGKKWGRLSIDCGIYPYDGILDGFGLGLEDTIFHDLESEDLESLVGIDYFTFDCLVLDGGDVSVADGADIDGGDFPWGGPKTDYDGGLVYET